MRDWERPIVEIGEDNFFVTQGGVNDGFFDDTQSREEPIVENPAENSEEIGSASDSEDMIPVPEYIINWGISPMQAKWSGLTSSL